MLELRLLTYREAISEAMVQALEENPKLLLMGEGVDDAKGAFGTTLQAFKRFGGKRVFDTPLSEAAMTGIGIGAAIQGYPSIMVHLRNEFLLVAMDQLVNHAAKWRYMSGGKLSVPIVIRAIVGRGWGQAAQHSQSLHGMFAQVPGLKVIAPSTPRDAKGLLLSAASDGNPVVCIEHRSLYERSADVPEPSFRVPIGQAQVMVPGKDLTCVAISSQVPEAIEAAEELKREGIEMEVIDPRTLRPLDHETILASVRKTGRLIVTDSAHRFGGLSAEIATLAAEQAFHELRAPVVRIGLPDAPTPCSHVLEKAYYPGRAEIVAAAHELTVKRRSPSAPRLEREEGESLEPVVY